MLKKLLYQKAIELTNHRVSSTLLRKTMTSPISKKLIPSYQSFYNIDTSCLTKPMQRYDTLQQFFTRQLHEGSRPICIEQNSVVSPVDGKIESFGTITYDGIYRVKGQKYTLQKLLGKEEIAQKYIGGHYIVFYLSPANYHRIHSPLNGEIIRQYVLGKQSYPVNKFGLLYGKQPLCENYRLISELETAIGTVAVIKVGAMFVNSIRLTNRSLHWEKGKEVGYFEFGSTVMMLFEKQKISYLTNVEKDAIIRVGEAFADMV